jgi:outer membrane protein assembly factor BamB
MSKPGFEFLWKMKLDKAQRPTEPILMERIIGYKGFKTLAFVGGSSDTVYAMDTDLARLEWEVQLPSGPKQSRSSNCPGGLTSALARPTTAAFPAIPAGFGGGGRGGPAKSEVGQPGEGAVTLARVAARQRPQLPPPAKPAAPPTPVRPARPGAPLMADGPFGRGITPVYAVAADGTLRILNVQNGALEGQPYPFLPPNAHAAGLIVVDGVAYATTDGGCSGGENGVWAVDTYSGERTKWSSSSGTVGPAAMAPDGSLYVATRDGELVRLEPRTLRQAAVYRAGSSLTGSPILFQLNERQLLAAPAQDGSIHLVDTAVMASAIAKSASSGQPATALASWQDPAGTRWLLASGPDSVVSWKVTERDGKVALERSWTSLPLAAPLRQVILNGVVFAASAGGKSAPVMFALDGASGKELWNSGKTITSVARSAGLSAGGGQVYLGTDDGTLYAFGFPMEH